MKARDLPPRLGDPLRLAWVMLGTNALLAFALQWVGTTDIPLSLFSILLFLASLPIALVLPVRRTNAYYLRSFRGDEGTTKLRRAIKQGLGRRFRLSGIRPPQRRTGVFWKHASYLAYCFRYATLTHMNLEAESGWLLRLWRSLGDARCAFLDLTDLTPNVDVEMRVIYQSLGAGRVMFVGDASCDEVAWRALIAEKIGLQAGQADALWVATWGRSPGWGDLQFIEIVSRFASQLPPQTVGVCHEAYEWVREWSRANKDTPPSRARHMLNALAGLAFVPLTILGLSEIIPRIVLAIYFGIAK